MFEKGYQNSKKCFCLKRKVYMRKETNKRNKKLVLASHNNNNCLLFGLLVNNSL